MSDVDLLRRACSIPDCPAAYNAATGPPAHEFTKACHWLRSSTFDLTLCPGHTHLMDRHRPHLDHATRTAACQCGLPLSGPTLGHMNAAWVDHARALLNNPKEKT